MNEKKTLNIQRVGENAFEDLNNILKGVWIDYRENIGKGPNGEIVHSLCHPVLKKPFVINEYGFFYNIFSCDNYDAVLRIDNNDFFLVEKDGKFGIIDKEEHIILPISFSSVSHIKRNGSIDEFSKLFLVEKDNKFGILDEKGDVFLPICFSSISVLGDENSSCNNIFLVEKNKRFGVYDEKGNIILHTCFVSIIPISDNNNYTHFIVSSDVGKFLYNYGNKKESLEYDNILPYHKYDTFIFESDGKYGLLDLDGNELLPAQYEYNKSIDCYRILFTYKRNQYPIIIENGLMCGRFPIEKDFICFRVGITREEFVYISHKNGKYGLITKNGKIMSEPTLDEIIWNKRIHCISEVIGFSIGHGVDRKSIHLMFIITRTGNMYDLFDAVSGKYILYHCDEISYIHIDDWSSNPYSGHDSITFVKQGERGYVTLAGYVLDSESYNRIEVCGKRYIVYDKKWKAGILNKIGKVIIPCVYDEIKPKIEIKGEFPNVFQLYKGNREYVYKFEPTSYSSTNVYEGQHYNRFGGAFGFSDEDIDTIFEGDPSAYWNID